ncbi:MAG: NADH-quinone oxidoreductase subunit H, partial [Fibromonadales bacterium]|nr:NADH-quinone oxidoreductase subunit H [Fibromonadales bacterium]
MIDALTVLYSQKPTVEWCIMLAKFAFIFIPVVFIALMITLERRGAGFIQDRQGPNRTGIPLISFLSHIRLFGLVQNGADGLKLFTKELFQPREAHGFWFKFAPAIPFMVVFLSPAVIPWFGPMVFNWGGQVVQVSGSILNLDIGVLWLFALGSLSIYGTVLGSWASNSKYSLLGGMRAGAMMISYEVSMGLSLIGMYILVGSFNLQDMVAWQEVHGWGILVQPIAFVIFLVSLVAETGRAPFDVAEGESELVSGFHTEFSGMRFAMFYMGEYAHIAINAALLATLFLGGYSIPFVSTETLKANSAQALAIICGVFVLGILAFLFMMHRYANWYRSSRASDRKIRLKEWALYKVLGWLTVPALLVIGVASLYFARDINAESFVAALIAAMIQILVLLFKMSFFCWLWIWFRWTLPRFRYDHVMHLGWIILLNVALVNLVVTAVVAKLVNP